MILNSFVHTMAVGYYVFLCSSWLVVEWRVWILQQSSTCLIGIMLEKTIQRLIVATGRVSNMNSIQSVFNKRYETSSKTPPADNLKAGCVHIAPTNIAGAQSLVGQCRQWIVLSSDPGIGNGNMCAWVFNAFLLKLCWKNKSLDSYQHLIILDPWIFYNIFKQIIWI